MSLRKLTFRAFNAAAVALLALSTNSVDAQVQSYSQDFETFATAASGTDGGAVGSDGWLGFATNFNGSVGDTSSFAFNYGTFPAPNGGPGFSGIADNVSQGLAATLPQQTRHLNVYSDYNEAVAHGGTTNWLDTRVFQDAGFVSAADVGSDWTFEFDYKSNSEINPGTSAPFGPGGSTNTAAYVQVLQSSNGSFSTLYFDDFDTTSASLTDWATASIQVNIDGAWQGELLQFGFYTQAQNGEPSGMLYDNVSFSASAVPEPSSLVALALSGVLMISRRRRS